MPRPKARPLFELGGQWIAEEPGRAGFYRYWNDAGAGRTRRASLGTGDFEDAKKRLAEIVVRGAPATVDSHLSIVLKAYFVQRTDHLPSAKQARLAGRKMLEHFGALAKVSACNRAALKAYAKKESDAGNSLNYVARTFSTLSAAFGMAGIAHGHIPIKEGTIRDLWPDLTAKPRQKVFEPSDEELARLFRQKLPEALRRWLLNSMATIGRPMAVAELCPAQRDRAHGLIALNPDGRRQNKKFRPTLREPVPMTAWLDEWEKPRGKRPMQPTHRYANYSSRSSIKTVLARACAADKADLPKLSLKSIRHRGTTVLRIAKVPKEQIDYQLGHVQEGARTTQDYGQYEPGYLSEATAALDAWIARVLKLAAQKQRAKVKKAA